MIEDNVITEQLNNMLETTDLPLGEKYEGKVRDCYTKDGTMTIVTTDRVSAFDRVLGCVPFKGQVLTQMALFWFKQTEDIIKNHIKSSPDPNVLECHKCDALPVEAVVRAYNTGSTTTSVWHAYKNGAREFCGNKLPDGMQKNQAFDAPIFTPSTKAEKGDHDESVSKAEIVRRGHLTQEQIDQVEEVSMKLFKRGQEIAAKQGLILVDTKYEFGMLNGELVVIDEVHTPDSSRYWYADSYQERFEKGDEPAKLDKEYIRLWLSEQGFVGDGDIPTLSEEVLVEAAKRYMTAYELVTGETFKAEPGNPVERIKRNMGV
ncbi:MAG: phosphoribosylaminoimidazolesuccinocarboxamide synthase [Candidatus Woesearchaeota archaeon]|nr:phosphoribosylaminoimidazolesuccinocarboxamide synthase [Candidatus Woesearchaeota archaeon]